MYKALVSFVGKITMAQDEVKAIDDKSLASDLIKAGYIVEVNKKPVVEQPKVEQPKVQNKKKK